MIRIQSVVATETKGTNFGKRQLMVPVLARSWQGRASQNGHSLVVAVA